MRPRLNAAKVDVSLSVMFKAFHLSAAKFSVVQCPHLLDAIDVRMLCFDLVLWLWKLLLNEKLNECIIRLLIDL